MEELKSLVNLANKQRIQQIEIIGKKNASSTSKLYRLFAGIADEKFYDDESAVQSLYGPSPGETDRAAYQKLKQRLHQRLLNTVFFIDPNEARFKNTQTAYYYCFKQLATVKILIGKGAREAAIPLAEKTLRKAMKFDITQVALELATDLRIHYAVNGSSLAQCRKYDKIVQDYSQLRQAEQTAEKYYAYLMVKATRKRSSDPELSKEARGYSQELEAIFKSLAIGSFRFSQLYFMVKILQHEILGDTQSSIEACTEAINYFKDSPQDALHTIQFTFAFKLLQAYIQAKKYNEAKRAAEKCEQILKKRKGSKAKDWLQVQYCRMLLCFQTKDYEEAYRIYQAAIDDQQQFDRQSKLARERWTLIEAYLHYLISIKKINIQGTEKFQNFRIGRFLNELPIFSQDKFGYNIDLIALNVLFSLHRGRYSKIIDRMESWKTYTYRFGKKRPNNRGIYFLRMLLCLPNANFHPIAVERHAEQWYKKLIHTPVDTDLELIPYETLWGFVQASLSQ